MADRITQLQDALNQVCIYIALNFHLQLLQYGWGIYHTYEGKWNDAYWCFLACRSIL